MARNLFVYGTLTFPEIVKALTGKTFASKPATLDDYFVAELPDHVFPGLVPKPGEIAKGRLILDVDELAYQQIAEWENKGFVPKPMRIDTERGHQEAIVFVWTEPLDKIKPWDRNKFEELHLNSTYKKRLWSTYPPENKR